MKNRGKWLIVSLVIVLIFVSVRFSVSAQTQPEGGTITSMEEQSTTANNTNASVPGGPGFIMVNPSAFNPIDSSTQWSFGTGGYLYNPGTSQGIYMAAVNLPHGAILTKMVVHYYDNSANKLTVVMAKYNLVNQLTNVFLQFNSSGAIADYQVAEIFTPPGTAVDNQNNSYWIEVALPGNAGNVLQIQAIRVDYSYPVNLPMIVR